MSGGPVFWDPNPRDFTVEFYMDSTIYLLK